MEDGLNLNNTYEGNITKDVEIILYPNQHGGRVFVQNFWVVLRGKSRILHFVRWRLMAESGALRREREAPLRSGKKSGRTAFLRQNFRVDRFLFWTESVSDCFSMQTTLLTCQQGAGGGGADLLETGLLEIRPPGQLLLLQDLVLDLRLLIQLDKWGRVR